MRKLDVLFIHPGAANKIYQGLSDKFSAIETPTWSLLLAQSCRAKGYGVAILDCDAERLTDEEAAERVKGYDPRLICFVVTGQNPNAGTTKMTGAISLAKAIKENCSTPICFGGSHTNALPEEVLAYDFVDFILTNEGVYALHNLLATDLKTDLRNIKGIGFKDDGNQVINEYERVVPTDRMDIDMPGSAWDLLPYRNKPFDLYRSCNWHANFIDEQRTPYAALYTSLGCRFRCDFCLHEDTNVIVSNGRNKKIKNITDKDKLLAFDTEKAEIVETSIVSIASREVNTILNIELSDGKEIKATSEHPFFVSGKWVNAGDLKVGDECLVVDSSDKRSFFAKHYNCMYRKDIARKSAITKAKNGHIPYMCAEEGRKKISAAAKKRALSPDNPMLKAENKLKASLRMRGDKNPCWAGGISTMYQQYPVEFSRSLKRKVKIRDNFTCQECNKYLKGQRLDIHHIDYNKHNNTQCNLICLCCSCHMKTNYHREEWTQHYKGMLKHLTNCPHYVRVKSVKKLDGNFKVYNFRCDPYNNFFAENILTHNCMINIVNRTNGDSNTSAANSPNMRFWSPELMAKETAKLYDYGVHTIRLSDEMFFLDKRYFEPYLNKLVGMGIGKDLLMWAYSRIDTVRPRYLELFRNAGVHWLALGIEAADQKIRKEITKGTYEEVNIRDVVKQIQDAGISVISNYIFGLPDDTYDSMNQTLDLALELNTEMANMYACFALPGSPLYNQAKIAGWELPKSFEAWSFHSYDCLPLPTKYLSAAEVLRFRDRAWQTYFSRPEYHQVVESRFGKAAADHIKDMTTIKLKRKLLGD